MYKEIQNRTNTQFRTSEGYEHVCTIALGYKDERPPAKPGRKDVIN